MAKKILVVQFLTELSSLAKEYAYIIMQQFIVPISEYIDSPHEFPSSIPVAGSDL